MKFFARTGCFLAILLVALIWQGPSKTAGASRALAVGENRSAEYAAFMSGDAFDAEQVEARFLEVLSELRRYRVLIVPSYLSDTAFEANERGMADYFVRHVEWLRAVGVEVDIVAIESEASVAENAGRVAATVKESNRPVCLLTHSKGGLDTLDFLIHASEEERAQVACWISLQAPFKGTPLADIITETPVIGDLAAAMVQALGGDAASITDLTTQNRSRYLTQNARAIQHVLSTVPTLCLASTIEDPEAGLLSAFMALTLDYLRGERIPSDGVVPTDSAILPGASHVVVRNVDHNATVATPIAAERVFDSESMLKVLFVLLLGPEWT